MKLTKATNYALHTMMFLAANPPDEHIGVAKLAERQGVSTTYLSKILTKLVKSGLVESVSGANGGYKLKPDWEKLSLLDVIKAIEGLTPIFDYCLSHNPDCLIQKAIESAEEKLLDELNQTRIVDLANKWNETSI
ncbi:Rrf2 family transcriptional regulator [Niallia sp.]|uniref:Rrf2 family transcriptional regulator n=1 Tax=Niallia sp. TaxID=2837523 RepID=UPI0028968E42|nr:Rrf2 family transcriptional regulator [Niallia sp.]